MVGKSLWTSAFPNHFVFLQTPLFYHYYHHICSCLNFQSMQKWFFLFFSGMFLINISYGQAIDSMLSVYHNDYQPEKLYLQFDKSSYQPGETIWFKAYIMAGESPSDFTRNFYVDWYDDLGTLIKHTVDPVFVASARGQFDIPTAFTGKALHIRAYTQWMLNFDSSILFKKDIYISQPTLVATNAQTNIPVTDLHFFPEGGSLVNTINTTVGFLATDINGMPVSIRGALVNNRGELIDSIASTHDGMGKFSLQSINGEQYSCNWTDGFGTSHTTALPLAKTAGIVVESQLLNNKLMFVVKRTNEAESNFKLLHAVASINQRLVFNASINLNTKKTAAGQLNTDSLGTGVLLLTIFDADWIPVAERILFINHNEYRFYPTINMEGINTGRREKNEWEIYVPDTLSSNLSISISDAALSYDSTVNIFSQLLLSSDIKGYVHNPAYYFSANNDTVAQNLDLVMLTHGWRKIDWEAIRHNRLPKLTYAMDSDYLQIKGKVYEGGHIPSISNLAISLAMQSKDSKKQFFGAKIDRDGTFRQRGLIFFDTIRLYYQFNDKRLSDAMTVSFSHSLPDIPFYRQINAPRFWGNSLALNADNQYYVRNKRFGYGNDSAVMLKNVIVKGNLKTPAELLDDRYTSGLFSSKNAYSFDVENDKRANGTLDVFHYLQFMVPGMTMSMPILGSNGAGDANSDNVPGINWRDGTPDIFLNEMPSDELTVMGIPMSDVSYVKVFRPPFMASSGSGASGAIAVYTKKPMEKQADALKDISNVLLTGYTAYREFYNPDNAHVQSKTSDIRPTLYWNPYLLTDKKNRTVKIVFYNNDVTKKIRIVMEGVNAAGKLARVVKIVE